ncbi:ATPase [Paraneptunicella aestuarii]|uniref:ATP-binding protein n=1 Tax=Paraneptunicella aestuarii TaxID=2831148 RepID=UPI001E478ABD|nr:ATP-binding protein [Paraneptunicella aestuarii]UAA37357.1 ATPase [Paraneptunicella aestuarii]
MKRLSLKIRIFSAALLALLLFIPMIAYALERAYVGSLSHAMLERMRVQTLTLISEFEIIGNISNMPELIINGQFNLPESGLYGIITHGNTVIWKSLSSMNWPVPMVPSLPAVGEDQFIQIQQNSRTFFLHTYTAEFSNGEEFRTFNFHVFQDKRSFDAEVMHFRTTLWYWLGIISIILLTLLYFTLQTALRPIGRLVNEILRIEKGNANRITDQYPTELEKLKSNLNHLLNTEENQRQRYKNSLGDLAHSLKTPLAVLSGLPDLPAQGREPVEQINNIIQRQLKRAVAGTGSRWNQKTLIRPIAQKLCSAMSKVYRDKDIDFELNITKDIGFFGDETDLMEMLGNLVDNACKAAESKVIIEAKRTDSQLSICVADDGPGIPEDKRQLLIERGKRLDSYESGQGIGMAVVSDLVSAYEGRLLIDNGMLGGAVITMEFPLSK